MKDSQAKRTEAPKRCTDDTLSERVWQYRCAEHYIVKYRQVSKRSINGRVCSLNSDSAMMKELFMPSSAIGQCANQLSEAPYINAPDKRALSSYQIVANLLRMGDQKTAIELLNNDLFFHDDSLSPLQRNWFVEFLTPARTTSQSAKLSYQRETKSVFILNKLKGALEGGKVSDEVLPTILARPDKYRWAYELFCDDDLLIQTKPPVTSVRRAEICKASR